MQILSAMIADPLLAIYRNTCGYAASLWILLAELRVMLFQRPTSDAGRFRKRGPSLEDITQNRGALFV